MPPDLLVLLCDTARADAFGPWGATHPTPAVARMAERGTVYADAVSPAPWTVPSTASILSGRLPTEHGITGECLAWTDRRPSSPAPCVAGYAGTWLPEALRDRGYRTWGASCNSWVSRWGGFDRGFDEFADLRPWARASRGVRRFAYRARKAIGRADRGGAAAVERFGRRLAAAGPEPLFALVNLMETHAPLDPPFPFYPFAPWRRGRTRWMAGGPDQGLSYNAGVRDPGPDYARTLRRLYHASARYEDRVLGRFAGAVRERGRPTVVVMVADHGEHLGEHGLFNHNSSLHQALLHVPLLVWGSGVDLAGGTVAGPASLLGLASWLTGVADGRIEPYPGGDGAPDDGAPVVSEYESTERHNGIPHGIAEGIRRTSARVPALVFHPGVAVRRGRWKYVATGDGGQRLYDVVDDPNEDRDLLAARPELAARFAGDRAAWERRRADRPGRPGDGAADVAEGEIAEHLRELGYIE
jgi:arylsulfatase A-like enzyme